MVVIVIMAIWRCVDGGVLPLAVVDPVHCHHLDRCSLNGDLVGGSPSAPNEVQDRLAVAGEAETAIHGPIVYGQGDGSGPAAQDRGEHLVLAAPGPGGGPDFVKVQVRVDPHRCSVTIAWSGEPESWEFLENQGGGEMWVVMEPLMEQSSMSVLDEGDIVLPAV